MVIFPYKPHKPSNVTSRFRLILNSALAFTWVFWGAEGSAWARFGNTVRITPDLARTLQIAFKKNPDPAKEDVKLEVKQGIMGPFVVVKRKKDPIDSKLQPIALVGIQKFLENLNGILNKEEYRQCSILLYDVQGRPQPPQSFLDLKIEVTGIQMDPKVIPISQKSRFHHDSLYIHFKYKAPEEPSNLWSDGLISCESYGKGKAHPWVLGDVRGYEGFKDWVDLDVKSPAPHGSPQNKNSASPGGESRFISDRNDPPLSTASQSPPSFRKASTEPVLTSEVGD